MKMTVTILADLIKQTPQRKMKQLAPKNRAVMSNKQKQRRKKTKKKRFLKIKRKSIKIHLQSLKKMKLKVHQ